ncbi:DUF6344 domain-containing protein [Streptomyces sp. NPDC005876]|uniref:DUF6344 domain-containing protein n=1 Tax=Streptomyces sp. NPDC005876 TaxID=3157076 RepID=UPI00340D3E89
MARNKVMTLWTAIVTAFLALFTALGLITTTASASVPRTEAARNSESAPRPTAAPAPAPRPWSRTGSLPPTMKQRIHAEAHGTSPSCRHRPLTDATAADPAGATRVIRCRTDDGSAAGHRAPADPPLQR